MLIVCCFVIGSIVYYQWSQEGLRKFKVAFLDVGQGDSALIQLGNGETMLIDCGADRAVLAELSSTLPFYHRTIDYLLVTHFDLDHYGGCLDVIKRYDVKHLLTNGEIKTDALSAAWWSLVDSEHLSAIVIERTSTWLMGDVRIEFLSPDPHLAIAAKDLASRNNRSIVFRLTHDDERYLFTGDIEKEVEMALVSNYCHRSTSSSSECAALTADVLKAPHHGSDTSSSEPFLKAVNPRIVVISVGKNNRYGHPSARVLKRLERREVVFLRTDQLGDISMPYYVPSFFSNLQRTHDSSTRARVTERRSSGGS